MGQNRKGKIKKARKLDAMFDVCVSHLLSPSHTHRAECTQAAPPQFLHANQEILERKDPVSINLRRLSSFLIYAR
jgi:hypothetical protein